MTNAHLVSGYAYVHAEASLTAFIDATDPPFIPMTDVRVRWLLDRRLAGRFTLALVQRTHIVGVGSAETARPTTDAGAIDDAAGAGTAKGDLAASSGPDQSAG